MLVTSSALSALRDYHRFAVTFQIAQQVAPFRVVNQRPDRHDDDSRLTAFTGLELALTVCAPLGIPLFVTNQMGEVRGVDARFDDDAASVTAVTAVRATSRNMSFSTKTHAAIATVAGFTAQLDLINKHRESAFNTSQCQVKPSRCASVWQTEFPLRPRQNPGTSGFITLRDNVPEFLRTFL